MKVLFKGLGVLAVLGVFLFWMSMTTDASARPGATGSGLGGTPVPSSPSLTRNLLVQGDGRTILGNTINGPRTRPGGYSPQSAPVELPQSNLAMGINTLDVPAYDWEFGCSAVSGAMIAAYYDRNGYPNIYTGPTNGGVMPLDNTLWDFWTDGYDYYPNNPLVASHQSLDGRTGRGSIDDYWVQYVSTARDPYLTQHWSQHAWGDAIGDFMKTSQSAYYNVDGSTHFYSNHDSTKLFCDEMPGDSDPYYHNLSLSKLDGTYGMRQFYQARGYSVSACYNQLTDAFAAGGFSYAQYKTEIDAGRPVMLGMEGRDPSGALVGHTIVGIGYDSRSEGVYFNDTWDSYTHYMTWTGTYTSYLLAFDSVNIVNLVPGTPPPAAFGKTSPANQAVVLPTGVMLSWQPSSGALTYQYCYDTIDDGACTGTWTTTGSTNVALPVLTSGVNYYWQVRASNAAGFTYANGSDTAFWSFHTNTPPNPPTNILPTNNATNISLNPTLLWSDTDPDRDGLTYDVYLEEFAAQPGFVVSSNQPGNSFNQILFPGTQYFWKIVARDQYGATTSGPVWSFTTTGTIAAPDPFAKTSPPNGATGVRVLGPWTWAPSLHAASYEVCYDTNGGNDCSAPTAAWVNVGHTTSYTPSGLNYLTTYSWQVRAVNSTAKTPADGADSAFASFTTQDPPPGPFGKTAPDPWVTNQPTSQMLSWGNSAGATVYEYCIDTTNDNACADWQDAGTNTSVTVELKLATTYYWQVRARNGTSDPTYADSGSWRIITTKPYTTTIPLILR
jgi:hypothetical protein